MCSSSSAHTAIAFKYVTLRERVTSIQYNIIDEENLHCLVREISGITPPTDGSDTHHHKTKLTCEVICLPDNPSTGKCHTQPLYDFNGSYVESFFEGMEERINTGTMELTVPPSAITNNSTIFIESPSDIILGCIDRRELRVESQSDHRALVTGIKKVLIIKLTDSSETNSYRKVTYNDWALLQDVFYDENNLVSIVVCMSVCLFAALH